jgi:hypothetical protein
VCYGKKSRGKTLAATVPATTLKEWGLARPDIQSLTVKELNDIGLMFMELHARQRGKKRRSGAGA